MDTERRRFLQMLGTVCSAGFARTLGFGAKAGTFAAAASGSAVAASAATPVVAGASVALSGIRQQVFEVIVRQALAGAPWQEICRGPMQVNGITEDEIKAEVAKRRSKAHTADPNCSCEKCVEGSTLRSQRIRASLDAIPHSLLSPCACRECRAAVNRKLHEIFRDQHD